MKDPNSTGKHDAAVKENTARSAALREYTGRSPVREGTGKHELPRGNTVRSAVVHEPTGRTAAAREATGRVAASRPAYEATERTAAMRNPTGYSAAVSREPAAEKPKGLSKRTLYLLIAIAAAALLMAVAMIIRNVNDGREYAHYYEQAVSAYDCGDYNTALSYLRKAYTKERTDECVVFMADCYDGLKKYDKALELLTGLNSRAGAVNDRIRQLEEKRGAAANVEKVSVAGKQYPVDTTGIVLDNLHLGNGVLDELRSLYALTNLSAAANGITDISAVSALGGLTTLNLSDNAITDLSPLMNLTALRTLYLDGNPIGDLTPLCYLSNLTTLSIKGVEITESQLASLSTYLPNCAIHSEAAQRNATDITLGGITFKSDVTELDLSNLGLRDVAALSGCRSLNRLDLHGNALSDLSPLMDIPALMVLDLTDNVVADLGPIMGLGSIVTLKAAGNYINSTAAVSMLSGLFELDLEGNPVRDFSGLARLRSLETLNLKNTGLEDEDLEYLYGLNSLRTLNIEDNEALSGEAVDELAERLPNCSVTHSELEYSVEFAGVSYSEDTEELDLAGLLLDDLSGLLRFKSLTRLDLSGTRLQSVELLSLLPGIRELDLSDNQISDVEPLKRMSSLRSLDLSGNPLTEEQVFDLSAALPGCDIRF